MAIEKMKLVRVDGNISSLEELITTCCLSGDFHAENAINYFSESLGFVSLNEENPYSGSISDLEEIASIAGASLKEDFDANELKLDMKEKTYVDEVKAQLNSFLERRNNITAQINSDTSLINKYKQFVGLDVPLEELFSTKFIKIRFGSIPRDCYPKLKAYENNPDVVFFECSQNEKYHWGMYITPIAKADEVDRIFASLYFNRIHIVSQEGTPAQIIDRLTAKVETLNNELTELDEAISSYWNDNSTHCEEIYTQLKIANSAFEMRRFAVANEEMTYFTLVGWVPQSSLKWFKSRVNKIENVLYNEYNPEDDKTNSPPVKLKNKKPFRPFEMFVEMYGLPSYGGFDVTPFIAITYTLLFGIMFADLGQGFVLALAGYLIYKIKSVKLCKIMVPCGLCSMIFGFVFGSVFGYEEMLDPVYHALGWSGKPLSVMENINTVIIMAVAIGVVLVFASMGLNIFCSLRSKKYGDALFSQNGLTGMLLYADLVLFIIKFLTSKTIIPASISIIVAVVCLVILYFKEILVGKFNGEENYLPEKWSDFFMQNFFEVIEYILTYFSNTVSFLRVGAFVLVHAGMMMVFASLTPDQYSGGGIAAMVVGNIIVMCLEGLLTGIQVLRLEYYEMFSRFYEGDGKPFNGVGRRKNRGFLYKMKNLKNDSNI